MKELTQMNLFEDENIYKPDGNYHVNGKRIADLKSKILLLLSDLLPAPEIELPSIKLLGQGSFNMVVGVYVKPKCIQGDGSKPSARLSRLLGMPPEPQTFALRIPMNVRPEIESMIDIQQDVANLQFVGQHLVLTTPVIHEYDVTIDNALGQPYILQSYIPGENLRQLWSKLNLKQKVSAIQQMTQTVDKIASITMPAAGLIAFSKATSPSTTIELEEFPIPTKDQAGNCALPYRREASEETPYDFLIHCCSRWIRHEERTGQANGSTTALWNTIMDIIHSLDEKGWLGDRFHLMHGDLFARNILVEIVSDTAVKITGIVDWDMACFVPKVVAFRAPSWAWNSTECDEVNENGANTGAIGNEGLTLKQAFWNAASPEHANMALADEGIIARKIFRVVTDGLLTTRQRDLAFGLISQWNRMSPKKIQLKTCAAV